MQVPLLQYQQEQRYWFADVSPIYVSYVSNDANYGGDIASWPQDFTRFVEAYMASQIIRRLSQDKNDWDTLYKLQKRRLTEAATGDAMESPTTFPPPGSWVMSRVGGTSVDGGSRGSLIG
jgi:hypothetical protein